MSADAGLALQGIRVVTLALNVPGPVAAQRLQRMGAAVTKVEPPWGDQLVTLCPEWYAELMKGQDLLKLNLKDEKERNSLHDCLERADVLITSFRPDSFRGLALDWETIHAKFPRLCHVAIVGFSHPRTNEAGHDLTYQASFGLLAPPDLPRTLLADLAGAELAVSCALRLLYQRERSGKAGYEEIPLADGVETFAKPFSYGLTADGGLLGGGLAEYNIYKSKNGWVALAALEKVFSERLKKEFHLTELKYESLQNIFHQKTSEAWEDVAKKADLPIAAIWTTRGRASVNA